MPASRPASSTSSWARARRSARRSRITRASTASCSPARTRWAWPCSTRSPRSWPRPCIVEMGGKNPAIVTRHADLDEAAEGIMRSAFGFGGQKCSANSRVYVERPVHDELVRLLVEKTETITIGDPLIRANWLGPIIDQKAVDRHQTAVAEARRDGTVFVGGERLADSGMERGFFVEPTVVGLPASHRLFQDELFAPFTAVAAVDSLDEALALANDSVLRPDRRGLQRGSGRGPDVPRSRSRPASRTSTAAPARRPGRGRASRRSAAGRAAARPARPASRCTTSRSSCASRATPSSTRAPWNGAGRRCG